MENSYRLVLFTPATQDKLINASSIQGYDVYTADTFEEAEQIISDLGQGFDAAIIPIKLIGENNGLTLCNNIVQSDLFKQTITILVDDELNRDSYLCGADFVTRSEDLHFQLQRVFELKNKLSTQEVKTSESLLFSALNSSTNGVLLFDPKKGLVYVNSYGANLLGLPYPTQVKDFSAIEDQFKNILLEHLSAYKVNKLKNKNFTSSYEMNVVRYDKYTFQASCNVYTVLNEKDQVKYLGLSLENINNIRYLSNKLIQAQQLNAVFFNVCSSCFMPYIDENKRFSIVNFIKDVQEELPDRCEIYPSITFLIEIMDLISSKDKNFKIDVDRNYILPLKSSDFIQILGLILLYISDNAPHNGVIKINTSSYIPGEGIYLTVLTESLNNSIPPSGEVVYRLLSGDFSDILSVDDAIEKTALELAAAQNIADRYGISIEYQNSNSYIKARFKLPVIVEGVDEDYE